MVYIKQVKLYVLFALSLMEYIEARYASFHDVGKINVAKDEYEWKCDKIRCPSYAYRCVVTQSNEYSPSTLVRKSVCYSWDGAELRKKVTKSYVDPKSDINVKIISYSTGETTFKGKWVA
ncbi:uncharacterized protein ACRADG_001814 [Cochliomyia hominivorax]